MKITRDTTRKGLKAKEVVIGTILVQDVAVAERLATEPDGKVNSTLQGAALLSQVCTFDGNKWPMEDVRKLELEDFLALMKASGISKAQELVNQQSGSPEKDDSQATT